MNNNKKPSNYAGFFVFELQVDWLSLLLNIQRNWAIQNISLYQFGQP
jgi:hypothetical protein